MNRLALGLLITLSMKVAHAAEPCGSAPVVTNESVRIEIRQRALTASRSAGNDEFSTILVTDRDDIFSRYPGQSREFAYYQYVVCQIIVADAKMATSEKISELNKAYGTSTGRETIYYYYWFLVTNIRDGKEFIDRSILINTGQTWLEIQNEKIEYKFKQMSPDVDEYIWIVDESRSLELKIPIQGGRSSIRYTGHPWQAWNDIHPAS